MMEENDSEPVQHVKRWCIHSYIGEPKADCQSTVLEKECLLAQLARKHMTPLCTTDPSERLFITAGNIVTD